MSESYGRPPGASPDSHAGVEQHSVVLLDVADGIATVTLNRPEQRNAISSELARAVTVAMASAEERDDVDVVILTGVGAGVLRRPRPERARDRAERTLLRSAASTGPWAPGGGTWHPMSKPVIGAINGAAVTGGLELALQCDLLVAAQSAKFGDTHARVGVFPGGGMIALLHAPIGYRAALAMSLTGNFIDAVTAKRLGLVVDVVADDELIPAARRLAADIASADTTMVRAILATYRRVDGMPRADAIAAEAAEAKTWHAKIDLADIRDRRSGVIERGRGQ